MWRVNYYKWRIKSIIHKYDLVFILSLAIMITMGIGYFIFNIGE